MTIDHGKSLARSGLGVFLAAVLLQSCVDTQDLTLADNTWRVGALLPFSGDLAASAPSLEQSLIFANERVAALSSVAGQAPIVYAVDSHSAVGPAFDVGPGTAAFQDLVVNVGAKAIMGPEDTELARRIAGLSRQASVVHFPGAILEKNTLAGGCSFITSPSAGVLGEALARTMAADGRRRVAILQVNDEYGSMMGDAIFRAFRRLGQVTASVDFFLGESSYRDALETAFASNPDALVLIAYPKTGASIVLEAQALGKNTLPWYFSPSLRTKSFVEYVPPGMLEGSKGVAPGITTSKSAFHDAFANRFPGDSPILEAFYHYDAQTMLLLAAIAVAARQGRLPTYAELCNEIPNISGPPGDFVQWNEVGRAAEILKAGGDIDYEGLSGSIDFDALGNVHAAQVETWTIDKNEIVSVTVDTL